MNLTELLIKKPNESSLIKGDELYPVKYAILSTEEFRDVQEINILSTPRCTTESGNVITYVWHSSLKFNKQIDLYSINVVPMYHIQDLEPGVWLLPLIYNPAHFEPKKEIRIIWNPSILTLTKEEILNKVEEFLTTMKEPNVPIDYKIFIRCTKRSIQ